ncbi:metallophosphoesterase family protein [Microvirga rosea]|uniref:metallophosphoesterase family protein n=1 Tax=Microvirga rosea TaxID=2715425 RepID=UPI001D0B8C4A|nr:metallophosphoesterase [Microvirga rosea]MCB8822241.1 metallophosphoesterase [Microvirga rosea]
MRFVPKQPEAAVPKIAIIADPHLHDMSFHPDEAGGDLRSVRTVADTVTSTRIFNEGSFAFRAALKDIADRGISLVVIAGDLLDDGQVFNRDAAVSLLREYSTHHGMRFFATPGNHDLFAMPGRHMSKRFLNPDGTHFLLTSDKDIPRGRSNRRIITDAAFCDGYEAALSGMRDLGYFRSETDVHWESPFGCHDALDGRTYDVQSDDGLTKAVMIDASYLVEPVEGLWLLSLDANVYKPKNGQEPGFRDMSEIGWNAVLESKPFLLSWIEDVVRRASASGKHLLVFSHYPVIGPLSTTLDDEIQLFGKTSFARRMPHSAVADAFLHAGVKVHFSGHWHVNETSALHRDNTFLINIAVPSPAAFPAAYKIAEFEGKFLSIETIPLHDASGFDSAFELYAVEAKRTAQDYGGIFGAGSYQEFLSRHLSQLVYRRYLPREWPDDFAFTAQRLSVGDLFDLAEGREMPTTADRDESNAHTQERGKGRGAAVMRLPFLEMVADWYRIRKGRRLALDEIADERIEIYQALISRYAAKSWGPTTLQFRIAGLTRMLQQYLAGPPSKDFVIDLVTGEIVDLSPPYFGRTDLRQTGRG